MRRLIAALLIAGGAPLALAEPHPCAAEAVTQATRLLAFHTEDDDRLWVDPELTRMPSLANPVGGEQWFDVLELWGYVYRARYRVRLIYAQLDGCVLMGQEILEFAEL